MSDRNGSLDDLAASFVFVRTGDAEPTAWMAEHPFWIKIPATLVPRDSRSSDTATPHEVETLAVVGTAAVATPEIATAASGLGLAGEVAGMLAGAAAPLAALGVLLYPSRTASPALDEVHPNREGFGPASTLPPLPGLVPPPEGDMTQREGGLAQVPPPPPLPGFDQAPPTSGAPEGLDIDEPALTILHQDRNNGLVGGARTKSERARKAARAADPEVTELLPDAEWRAHHLINVAGLRIAPDVIEAAARAGWRTDDTGNVAALPASPEAQQKLKAAGVDRPIHDSGHRNWNAEVEVRLRAVAKELRDDSRALGPEAYSEKARKALEELQNDLKDEVRRLDRLTQSTAVGQLG